MKETPPAILVVDDKPNMLRLMTKVLRDVAQVYTADSGAGALAVLDEEAVDVVLCDLRMPDLTGLEVLRASKARQPRARFILMTAYATVQTAVAALKEGAYDYLTKPFEPEEARSTILRALHSVRPRPALAAEVELLPGVHARSADMKELAAVATQIATTDINVLIVGESGTGKGQLARAIHQLSAFRDLSFHHLDCRALPPEALGEAIERLPEVADAGMPETRIGTLFVDEVDALGTAEQVALGRAVERLRAAPNPSERGVRLITATTRDLEAMVAEGAFRRDLFFKLRVAFLNVPPLRRRREDIPVLAATILAEVRPNGATGIEFTAGAMERMSSVGWPGNVRELRAVVEHAAALAGDKAIDVDALPEWIHDDAGVQMPLEQLTWSDALARGRADVARRYLVALLKHFDGDVVRAAAQASVERESFYRLLRRHGIQPEGFRRDGG